LFILKQFYTQNNHSIQRYDTQPSSLKGLTKLSLFKPEDDGLLDSTDDSFQLLIEKVNDQLFFRKDKNEELVIWEVFATKKVIETSLMKNLEASSFDFILWPTEHFQPPKLLVFDMDSTFIQIEVIDELARKHGVGESVSKVTEAAMRGELDFSESLISRVACLKGLAESTIADIANNLPLSAGVEQLVSQGAKQQVETAIVSGGFTPFVEHLRKTMGLYEVKANNLEIIDNQLTGKVLGEIVDAQAKAVFVNHLKGQLQLQVNDILTIGDGANDLLMMKESGFSLAYRAKPAVQAQAKGRMNHSQLNHLLAVFGW